jgi:protease IV
MISRSATVLLVMLSLSAVAAAQSSNAPAKSSDGPSTQPTGKAVTTAIPTGAQLMGKLSADTEPATAPSGPQVAFFDLDRTISEKPANFDFMANEQSTTLRSVLERLEKAKQDKDLKGVLISLNGTGLNISQALELRDALQAVRQSGKRTFVYADAYDADSFMLASGASDVCLLGGGEIELPGVGLETMFAKGLLDKLGVEADFEQIGEYKGADEEFIHTQPSPEMRGEMNKLVDSFYAQLIDNISRNRHLPADTVRRIVDQALIPAEQAKSLGLVDHLVDADGLRDLMSDELGGKVELIHDYAEASKPSVDLSNPFGLLALLAGKHEEESDRQAVAIIYAEGVIVDGSTADGLFGDSGQIGSEDLRRALRIVERDDQISAVVLRIDSPGGSALASEAMWQAVRRVAKTKPVIVSIGSMAASGGYYLASSSNYIFADPTAIVGSIGVVGGKFVLRDLFDKIGIGTADFQRGANAGLFSSTTPWTPQQRQMVYDWMHQTYEQFTQRVMTTRKGKIKDIDKVARGRIYLASQAKDLGMVDAIGGLSDAIDRAARDADLPPDSYDVRIVPPPKTLADFLNGDEQTKLNLQPKMAADAGLLDLLPADQRTALQEQLNVLRVLQAHPVAVVCPYVISMMN